MSQFARPDTSSWTIGTNPINAATRSLAVNEVIQDDSDYVEFTVPGVDFVRWHLSDVTDPSIHTGHIIRFARTASSTGGVSLTYRFQNFISPSFLTIAQFGEIGISSGTPFFAGGLTLSEAAAALIVDYTQMYFRVDFDAGPADAWVSWVEMEVPDPVVNPIGTGIFNVPVLISASVSTTAGAPVAGTSTITTPELQSAATTIYDPSPRTGPVSITAFELASAGFAAFSASNLIGSMNTPEVVSASVATTLNPITGDVIITLPLVTLTTSVDQIQGGAQVGDWKIDQKEVDTWVEDGKETDVWVKEVGDQDWT